ncbi:polysaccharide biosynthesis/export family protein [Antarcticibacterium sp. 1MA-6-2]|uniref:polysaccharide biosynthesis/export family protein n=1 Tax=Antarcticibacterium sp. 1MA-6-2 TaxID=2908210 RepID=UPI001F236DDD|nr:polysaccharide biosynthesis/export family protein [Antarcticibacterium sp. 1MA-6-2]UJH89856.1 polysaccharide biosynthesis/export family protein [Antarcticibacterium sp. 1MA-6-2]
MKLPKFFIFSVLAVLVSSCVSGKKITYFQNIEDLQQVADASRSNLSIKPNDLLTISVSGPEPEAVMPFNLPVVGVAMGAGIEAQMRVSGTPQLQSYLVDSEGNIEFPILGTVEVAGLNRQELAAKLKQQISDYVQNPIVNVRIVNFQVSVLGEVNRPGTFTIQDEYLSLPKALGLAGDMSIYGMRENVLVMREEGGVTKSAYLDLTDANVVNSPFYYLQQNDVVYVEPNGAQKQGAAYNRNATVYISIASVLISLAILITR